MPRPIGENALFYSDDFILCGQISRVNVDFWAIVDLLWAGYKRL